jgi:hypothetical protein
MGGIGGRIFWSKKRDERQSIARTEGGEEKRLERGYSWEEAEEWAVD